MLRFDAVRKTYSAEIKHRTFGRIHLAMKTGIASVARRREVALQLLLDTGEPVRDLVEALRGRKLTIEAVTECVRAKLPFDTLRPSTWPTLGDGAALYLKALEAKESGSAKTVEGTKTALDHAIAWFGASARLEAITHDAVATYKAYLAIGVKLHTNTVGLYLTKFGALYTFLQKRETKRALQQKRTPSVLFSPLDREEHVPAPVKTRVRFLTEAEADLLLAATPESMKLVVALGLFAGLRLGEVSNLRPSIDLDAERGVLFIQSRDGWQPKYGRNREVPISSALEPYIDRHLLLLPTGSSYVFPGRSNGTALGERRITEIITRVVTDAGLQPGHVHPQGVTMHTTRHTFASWLVMSGADLLTVSRLMGHTSTKQVEQVYAHLSPQHRLATVELLSTRWYGRPQDTTGDTTDDAN